MKLFKPFAFGLAFGPVVFFVCFVILALSGCSRTNAPDKDASGTAPTGNTLTVRITADAPSGYLSVKRGSGMPIDEDITLPFERTYNVTPGDAFNLAAGAGKASPGQSLKANLRIAILYNGKEVSSCVESDVSPAYQPMLPGGNTNKAYMAQCGFTVPS